MRLALVLALVAAACSADPAPPSLGPTSIEICQRPKNIAVDFRQGDRMTDHTLVFTFDDGPAEVTSELSTYLKSEGIAATFFVNGANFPGLEAAAQQVVADGHLIGNHTQTHAALTTLVAADVLREVEETDALIKSLVPEDKLFFRPPFGDFNAEVQRVLSGSAMNKYQGPVGWDIGDHVSADSGADWDCWGSDDGSAAISVDACGALYLKEIRAKAKGIVLMHDGPPGGEGAKTLEMVKAIVPVLKKEGFRFARLDSPEAAQQALPAEGAGAGGGSGADGGDPCAKR